MPDNAMVRPRGFPTATAPAPGGALVPFGIGVAFGIAALAVSDIDLRWLVWSLVGLCVGGIAVGVRDKEKLLWGAFVLAFQADIYLRIVKPHGSDGGLGLSLSPIVGLALGAWYLSTNNLRRLGPPVLAGRLGLPIAALLGTSLLSLATTSERFVGIGRLFFELQLYFVYLLALNVIRSEERLAYTLKLLFAALAMQSVVYFIQSAIGQTFTLTGELIKQGALPRPGGTVSTNPAGFASFIMPILLIAVTQLVTRPDPRHSRYAGVLAALGAIAIGLTFTRAAWVGLAIGLVWIVVVSHRRRVLQPARVLMIGLGLASIVLVLSPLIAMRLADSVRDSYDERASLMRMALRVIAANPITGVGAGAYGEVYKAYLTPEMRQQWLAGVHNEYLLRTAETGILGGAAFVVFLVVGLRQVLRLTRTSRGFVQTTAIGWSAALAALCWEMYWDMWRGFTYNAMLWFMLGLTEAAERLGATPRVDVRPVPRSQGSGSSDSNSGGEGSVGPPDAYSSAPMSQRAPWGLV